MFLLGKKTKSVSIVHPLGHFDEVDVDRANELKKRLEHGDNDAADLLVRGHLRLAISIAGRYAATTKKDIADELVSEACFAMARMCQRIMNHEVHCDNITSHLAGAIHGRCSNFVLNDRLFGCSHTSKKKGRKSPKILSLNIQKSYHQGYDEVNAIQNQASVKSDMGLVELQDLIDSNVLTDFQREIIKLRACGYDIRTIATQLGCSKSLVSKEFVQAKSKLKGELDD